MLHEPGMIDSYERELVFDAFSEQDAWAIGLIVREWAAARQWPIAIDIRLFDRTLLTIAMPGATADNFDWIRRKSAVVQRFHCSSLAMARKLKAASATLTERYGISDRDFAASGGSVPLLLKNCTGPIGAVTVSGLSQGDDHRIVVKAMATRLGLEWAEAVELPS